MQEGVVGSRMAESVLVFVFVFHRDDVCFLSLSPDEVKPFSLFLLRLRASKLRPPLPPQRLRRAQNAT